MTKDQIIAHIEKTGEYIYGEVLKEIVDYAADGSASIDDNTTASNMTWSSNKIQDELGNKANTNGTYENLTAGNLASWEERDALSVEDTWSGIVQTTGGSESIDSDSGFKLVSIVPLSNFYADFIVNTGFNLDRYNVGISGGLVYIVVPTLEFGEFGTAAKPNGILFTDSEGNNLQPDVYFKPLDEGIPTSSNYGTQITPVISNGYSFYCTSEPGYLVYSKEGRPCVHIAWSRRYDEYISISDASDAGSTFSISPIIRAIHDYDMMLVVGNKADRIDYVSDTQVQWTRYNDRVLPTWTTVEDEETGTYTHSATISGMLSDGSAECCDADGNVDTNIRLTVNSTTVSYTDSNASATSDYVHYNLATIVTGTYTIDTIGDIEDWGITYLDEAVGDAFITMQYAQGYPDAVAQLLANLDQSTVPVISEAIAKLQADIDALNAMLTDSDVRVDITARTIDATDYMQYGVPAVLYSSTAGAPSSSVVPDNWDEDTMGIWTGVPRFIGQRYIDQSTPKEYCAKTVTNSTSDWF